jgi:hypothetical protein
VRGTLRDLWEESFHLILFNVLWLIGSLPGLALIALGASSRELIILGLGLILAVPFPYVTFGIFHAVGEVVQGNAVGTKTFFSGGRQFLSVAYTWGGINLVILALLYANSRFYGDPSSPLGGSLLAQLGSSLLTTVAIIWIFWQLFALAVLHHFPGKSLRGAYKESGRIVLQDPIPVFAIALLALLIWTLGVLIPPLGFLISFAAIAVLVTRLVVELSSTGSHESLDPGSN